MVRLGELCQFISGGTPRRDVQSYFAGDIPWITGADITDDQVQQPRSYITQEAIKNSATNIIPAGNILLVTRTGVGKVAINEQNICISQDFTGMIPNDRRVDVRYLYHCLRNKKTYFIENQRGATIKGVTRDVVSNLEIPIPYPDDPARSLETQRCIVARIEALFAELREARRLHAEIVADTGRVMEAALGEVFREIGRFTQGVKAIDKMTIVTSGGTPSRSRADYYGGTIPWVKTGELKDNTIMDTEEYITELALEETNAKKFPVNTLLIAMYGQGQTRGRTGVLGIKAVTNQACCAIFPNPDEFDSFFLQFWFRHIYSNLRQLSESRGGSQPNLNQGMIKKLKPPLPDLPTQHKYAEYLTQVEIETLEMRKVQEGDSQLLSQLEQSILAQAFRGEL